MLMLSQTSLTLGKQKDFTSQLCKQQKIKYGTFISANHLGHFFQGASAFYYKSCLTSCPQLSAALKKKKKNSWNHFAEQFNSFSLYL